MICVILSVSSAKPTHRYLTVEQYSKTEYIFEGQIHFVIQENLDYSLLRITVTSLNHQPNMWLNEINFLAQNFDTMMQIKGFKSSYRKQPIGMYISQLNLES